MKSPLWVLRLLLLLLLLSIFGHKSLYHVSIPNEQQQLTEFIDSHFDSDG
jgi:hypothetical protein